MTKCMDIVNSLDQEDQDNLLAKLDRYIALGVPPGKAQRMAATDVMEELKAERAEFVRLTHEQHPDLVAPGVEESKSLKGNVNDGSGNSSGKLADKKVGDAAGESTASIGRRDPAAQGLGSGPGKPAAAAPSHSQGHPDQNDIRAVERLEAKLRGIGQIRVGEPGIKASPANADTKALDALLDVFADLTGKRGIAIDWANGSYGLQHGDNFFVNVSDPDIHVAQTMGHEFSHLSERFEGIGKLHDQLWAMIGERGRREYFDYLKRSNQVKSPNYMRASSEDLKKLKDEMLADFMGQRFNDKEWLASLALHRPKLFGDFVRDWVKLLGNIIAGLKGKASTMAGVKNIDKYIAQLEEAKAIAQEVAILWAERNPTSARPSVTPKLPSLDVQLTWKAKPGKSTGLFRNSGESAPSKHKEYLMDMEITLAINPVNEMLGWGADSGSSSRYKSEIVGAGNDGLAGFAFQSTLHLPGGSVNARTKNEINFFLATHGMWLAQDDLGWHTPKFGQKGLGVEFNLRGRKLTLPEFEELYSAVRLEFGDSTVVPIQSKAGVRFLNSKGMDQSKFINKLKKAINDTSIYNIWFEAHSGRAGGATQVMDHGVGSTLRPGASNLPGGRNNELDTAHGESVRTFDFDGDHLSNDWSRGEGQFRTRAIEAWRAIKDFPGYHLPKTEGDLDAFLDDVQRRVDDVNAEYSKLWGTHSLTPDERKSGIGARFEYPHGAVDPAAAKKSYFKRPDGSLESLYHGTTSLISEVKSGVGPATKTGAAFYASSSPDYAAARAMEGSKSKAKWRDKDVGANVIPVYITASNPFDWRIQAHRDAVVDAMKIPKGHTREGIADGIKAGEWMDIERKEVLDAVQKLGFDSFLIRDDADSPGYIGIGVFNPDDVIFAIGYKGHKLAAPDVQFSARDPGDQDIVAVQDDRGQPDPLVGTRIVGRTTRRYTQDQLRAFSNVGFQVEVPSLKDRFKSLWKDAGKKLAQGLVDQFAPIKALSLQAYGLLRLAKGSAGSFETLLKGGKLKLTDGVYDFDETRKGGVIDKLLMPMQGEHHDFLRWVAANRAEGLMADGKEHLFSHEDIAAIKTLSDGQLNFDFILQHGPKAGQATRARSLMYADSLVTFNGFNDNVLDMAEQSGLIGAEEREAWTSEFYVPFFRASDEDGIAGPGIRGGVVRNQAFKRLKGGADMLNADLLDNTLMNWAHLLDAAAKNRAAKASLMAAESAGIAVSTDEETARQMGKATGNRNGVVWFMDDGAQHYYLVDDPFVLQAITALDYAGMRNPMMNALSAAKNALTIGVTASPFFKIRNLIRDSVQVIGTGSISYNPAKNLADGWKLTNPENDIYFRLLAGGGTIHFGTMLEGSEAKRVQALVESGVDASTILGDEHQVKAFYRKWIEPGVTAYNELGNRGEAINRAALYDQLVKQGVSHAEASLQARDLMDFSMQGSFATIRFLSQVLPFFNARLQGLYKLGRAANEDPKRMAYVTAAIAMASLALLAMYGDDDDWKKREEWDRNNYWWFKFGGKAFRIPKPFELGAVGTLAERSAELLFDGEMTGKRFRSQVMSILADNLSMSITPQLVKPMLDVYANKDGFTGRPIEPLGMERLKSDYRFNGGTSMTARAASTALNSVTGLVDKESLSPLQIDSLITGYFGWLGMISVATADIAAREATSQPSRPSVDLWKAASAGMISTLGDSPSSRYVTSVYDQAHAIEEAYSTWHALQRDGKLGDAADFRMENLDMINAYRTVESIKSSIAKINQQIRLVERSDSDGYVKRDEIRKLNARKDQLAKTLTH